MDDTRTPVLTGTCDFPMQFTSAFVDTVITTFEDRDGRTARIALKITEQDTFTANGNTLVGLPYRFNTQIFVDDEGDVERIQSTGVAARIPLPDGRVLLAAGKIDVVANNVGFVLVPDRGTPVDVDAFCAALSSGEAGGRRVVHA